jgi:hypothetical protein
MAVALKREHPPLGAMVLITDRGATQSYVVPVERYLGRYFYAGEHRFHVADDLAVGHFRDTNRRLWRTTAAFVVELPPEEAEHLLALAAAAAPVVLLNPKETEAQASSAPLPPVAVAPSWLALPEPVGPDEPTEHW